MKEFRNYQVRLAVMGLVLAALLQAVPNRTAEAKGRCNHKIAGTITRRTDVFGTGPTYRPVIGVEVFLLNNQGEEVARTRTDRSGHYAFENLCPGAYAVRPGLVGPMLPSLYEPGSTGVTVPPAINSAVSPLHVNFVRKQPPPPRQPEADRQEERIHIDEATKAGSNLELANSIKRFLTDNISCSQARLCRLTILVENGHVGLSGLIEASKRLLLRRITREVPGVLSLSLTKVATAPPIRRSRREPPGGTPPTFPRPERRSPAPGQPPVTVD